MKFIPHDYQSYCTEYIKTHPVAALFLDTPYIEGDDAAAC